MHFHHNNKDLTIYGFNVGSWFQYYAAVVRSLCES